MGDMIAFLGSVFGAFNLQILAPLLQVYREGIYVVLSNLCVYFISLTALLFSEDDYTFGVNPKTGLFGFLHPK